MCPSWLADLADYALAGQDGNEAEDGGDLLAGQWEEGGDQRHEGLGRGHEPGGVEVLQHGDLLGRGNVGTAGRGAGPCERSQVIHVRRAGVLAGRAESVRLGA